MDDKFDDLTLEALAQSEPVRKFFNSRFLKSCMEVEIPNPFGNTIPLKLCYGKSQFGQLNDKMQFEASNGEVFEVKTILHIRPQ